LHRACGALAAPPGTNCAQPDWFETPDLQMKARCVMNFGYTQPFSFKLGARSAPKVAGVRHGVTEITLSDGRLVRATLHVKAVTPNPKNPGTLDISYNVITEVMVMPDAPILAVHETIQ
jgi:hypothetical protein